MNKKIRTWSIGVFLLFILLVIAILFALSIGSTNVHITFMKIPRLLFAHEDTLEKTILTQIRLPRIILAVAIGGALSIAGVLLQGIFHNPLVEPYTLGISGGGTLGVALCFFFKLNDLSIWILPLAGFVGSFLAVNITYFMSCKYGKLNINNLLLVGVMISFISSSLVMLIMTLGTDRDIKNIFFWIIGSLDELQSGLIGFMFIISIVGLFISYLFCKPLNAFLIGEEDAKHLGINTEGTKKALFILASILTGVSVSIVGIIGFVGLAIPHFCRILFGYDHRILLISSFLSGGIFLILCDTIARSVGSTPLPVGVISGILGGSVFVYALTRKKMI